MPLEQVVNQAEPAQPERPTEPAQPAEPQIVEKPFGIDPNMSYDRNEFVGQYGKLDDLEDYYKRISKEQGDVDARIDLANLVSKYTNDQRKIMSIVSNSDLALLEANSLLSEGHVKMAKYVENNRTKFLDELSSKQLFELVHRISHFKTGNPEYDKASQLMDLYGGIKGAENDEGKLVSIIAPEAEKLFKKIPKKDKQFAEEHKEEIMKLLIAGYTRKVLREHSKLFIDANGDYRHDAIADYFEENCRVAEDILDDPDYSKGEKEDVWDKNLKSIYLELAKALYPSEKKAKKWDDDEDKEIRKAYVKSKGMGI